MAKIFLGTVALFLSVFRSKGLSWFPYESLSRLGRHKEESRLDVIKKEIQSLESQLSTIKEELQGMDSNSSDEADALAADERQVW